MSIVIRDGETEIIVRSAGDEGAASPDAARGVAGAKKLWAKLRSLGGFFVGAATILAAILAVVGLHH